MGFIYFVCMKYVCHSIETMCLRLIAAFSFSKMVCEPWENTKSHKFIFAKTHSLGLYGKVLAFMHAWCLIDTSITFVKSPVNPMNISS